MIGVSARPRSVLNSMIPLAIPSISPSTGDRQGAFQQAKYGRGRPPFRIGKQLGVVVQSCIVRHYSDPSEYIADCKWSKADLCITARGNFSSKRTRISLPRVLIHQYSEELPRVSHIVHAPDRALFIFATRTGPSWFTGAAEIPPGTILRFGKEDQSFQRSTGRFEFGAASMSIDEIEDIGATYGSGDFEPPRDTLIVAPTRAAMVRLQRIHTMAIDLAEQVLEVIAVPQAARGLEQALLTAMADCFVVSGDSRRGMGSYHRSAIMRRFYGLLEAHPDGVLHTLEICKALGVSNRTLTTCCNEALGMSPHRYLKVRQLHLARRALRKADPIARTVTEIATEYGFWDLGRFAAAYRELFGELPSETLSQGAAADPIARVAQDFVLASEIT
jgi:AraC-like DNA-binding protein